MTHPRPSAMERCLQRIDAAMAALDELRDAKAASVARELAQAILDLHGLALAKAIVIVQGGGEGDVLARRLAADAYVGAALLLHGLHPEEAETRLRSAIAAMRPHWGVRGFRVELRCVDGASARAQVFWSEPSVDRRMALREIEQTLTDAAPDLDTITLEEIDRTTPQSAAADALPA